MYPNPEYQDHFAKKNPFQIIIGEDDQVSQMVAEVLFNSLGYQVELVSDGSCLLEELERNQYNLVFLDINMPGLDGLQTSREIRKKWTSCGQVIYIVAMMTNSSEVNVKECYAAGMDAYVKKPLEKTEIMKAIQWISAGDRPISEMGSKSNEDQDQIVDKKIMIELVDNLGESLQEIVLTYLQDTPVQIELIKQALAAEKPEEVYRRTHSLKSSSGIFGARRMQHKCLAIESNAKNCLPILPDDVNELTKEFDLVKFNLQQYIIND